MIRNINKVKKIEISNCDAIIEDKHQNTQMEEKYYVQKI